MHSAWFDKDLFIVSIGLLGFPNLVKTQRHGPHVLFVRPVRVEADPSSARLCLWLCHSFALLFLGLAKVSLNNGL